MKGVILLILCTVASVNAIVDRTYFNYLGLKINATSEDIEKAFQSKKAKIDSLSDENEKSRKLKLLKQAYSTLSNDKERQKYERYGRQTFRTIKEMTCIDKRNPEKPKDLRKTPPFKLSLPVSIGDIFNGTTIKAKYPKKTACPVCMGTGAKSPKDLKPCSACAGKGFSLVDGMNFYGQRYQTESFCPVCKASGKTVTKTCDKCKGNKLVETIETVQITIPAHGLKNGKTTLRNFGEEDLIGVPSDLEVTIVEIPSGGWSREGTNLVYKMVISLQEMLFGFTKQITHLDGSMVEVTRSAQTTNKDTRHVIKQKGLLNDKGFLGNLIVRFKITIPKFNNEQLGMWQDFFEEYNM